MPGSAAALAADVVVVALALLSIWGIQRAVTLIGLVARRGARGGGVKSPVARVTVQVPLYNEPRVCGRAVDAACRLRWPDLEVQILDDSTDATVALVAAAVARWRAAGVDVVHVRRAARTGFKAGALAHGLASAKGEAIAIFDADFVPAPDFLERTVPLLDDAEMVQARWGHLNRDASWLTRAQAALLDAHFAVEQRGRARGGRFFGFNGTAGVWRKQAIIDAGGWDARTLTEDLDLSVRAWAQGARFVYVDDVVVPAELPDDVDAWTLQQHRWSKGALQTARARMPRDVDTALKLTQNLAFALLALVVALAPLAVVRGFFMPLAALPAFVSLAVGLAPRGRRAPLDALLATGLCAAMSLRTGAAALAGLLDVGDRAFHRTPKSGERARRRRWRFLEPALGAVHVVTAASLVVTGHALQTPFLWLCGASLLAVGLAKPAAHQVPTDGEEGGGEQEPHPARQHLQHVAVPVFLGHDAT